jgi:hypothetical protein
MRHWVENVGRNGDGEKFHEWFLINDYGASVATILKDYGDGDMWMLEMPYLKDVYFEDLETAKHFTEEVSIKLAKAYRWPLVGNLLVRMVEAKYHG